MLLRLFSSALILSVAATAVSPDASGGRRHDTPAVSAWVGRPVVTSLAPRADSVVAVTHVTLIDGTGAPARRDQTLILRGRRIVASGPAARTPVPAGARVLDGRGRYVIPGLWDMHVHAFHEASFNGVLLANGITGARDMGDILRPLAAWRARVRSGALVGPRLVVAGGILDAAAAVPWRPFMIQVTDSARAEQVVDSLARGGVDFIKTYTTLTPAVLRQVVAAARRRGLSVAGHLPVALDPVQGARAGLRTQEHLYGFLLATSTRERAMRDTLLEALRTARSPFAVYPVIERQARTTLDTHDPAKARALYARLAATGGAVVPTLAVLEYPARLDDSAFVHDPALRSIPAIMRARATSVDTVRQDRPHGVDDALAARVFAAYLRTVGELHRAGVRILAGTDAPNPFTAPGDAMHRELALLVRAGLSPMDALLAATREPTRHLGLADSLGTLAPGKLADLVVLDADPLADIANTRRIHAVVVDGVVIDSTARAAMLEDALRAADALTSWGSPRAGSAGAGSAGLYPLHRHGVDPFGLGPEEAPGPASAAPASAAPAARGRSLPMRRRG